jgi:hypothetical protein
MTMKELRLLAAELKAAHDLQAAAMKKQGEINAKIIAVLGPDDGREFLHMLQFQARPPDLSPVFRDDEEIGVEDASVKFRVVGSNVKT